MFLGKYPCALDGENRLSIPTAIRGPLTGAAYITQGFERNLLVLTAAAFHEIYQRVKSLNMADPLARLLLRMILGTANESAGMDDESRISLPLELRKFAGLGERVLLIGQGDYLEIWSPESWSQQEALLGDVEANAARFSMLTVSTQ